MVKSEFEMRGELLVVPASIDEPRLCAAGLAWLDMALELFSQEVFSELELRWYRPIAGTAPVLQLTLDSSKNFRTKKLQDSPDAPPAQFKRRERFDAAVAKMFTRTTPEDLWAALANQRLACLHSHDFLQAWESAGSGENCYPRFTDSKQFLFYLMQYFKIPAHPWL
jgi:hypothetical protein